MKSRAGRTFLAALGAGAATAGAMGASAVASPGTAGQPQAQSAVATLSIVPSRRTVVLGGTVRISGRLTGVARPAGQRVELISDEYPYGNPGLAASGVTRANGTYSFLVRPARNTRYFAQASGDRTLVRTILVPPRNSLGAYQRPGGRLYLLAVMRGTAPLMPSATTLYWYWRATGTRVFRRLGSSPITGPAGSSMRSSLTVRDPRRPGTSAQFFYCAKRSFLLGHGPLVVDTRCGAPTLPLSFAF